MKATLPVKARPTALVVAFALFLALALSGLSPRTLTLHPGTFDKSASLSNRAFVDAYGKLPLSFEANRGQTDSREVPVSRPRLCPIFNSH
jgi:hypothetical protein